MYSSVDFSRINSLTGVVILIAIIVNWVVSGYLLTRSTTHPGEHVNEFCVVGRDETATPSTSSFVGRVSIDYSTRSVCWDLLVQLSTTNDTTCAGIHSVTLRGPVTLTTSESLVDDDNTPLLRRVAPIVTTLYATHVARTSARIVSRDNIVYEWAARRVHAHDDAVLSASQTRTVTSPRCAYIENVHALLASPELFYVHVDVNNEALECTQDFNVRAHLTSLCHNSLHTRGALKYVSKSAVKP